MTPDDHTTEIPQPPSADSSFDSALAGSVTVNPEGNAKPRRRRGLLIGGIAAGVVVLAGVGVGGVYAANYADKALPGTTVAGVEVGGQTREEIQQTLDQRVADATLNVSIAGEAHEAKLADLGYSLDTAAMVDQAFENNSSWTSRLTNMFASADIPAKLNADQAKFDEFAKGLTAEYGEPTKDAAISFDEGAGTFVAVPGVVGKTFDEAPVIDAAQKLADTLEPQTVEVSVVDAPPAITDEMAQNAAPQADALLQPVVFLRGKDANTFVDPTKADKAKWIAVTPDNGGTAVLSEDKMRAWVKEAAESIEVDVVNGIKNVDAEGNELTVAKEGVAGYTTNNVDQIATDLINAVKNGAEFDGEFTYDRTPEPTYETRQALPNAKDLAYPAAEGERWIEVDLTEINTSLWEGDKEIATIPVVPGDPRAPTPEGRFNILWKVADETMRGENFGGGTYEVKGVPWASYFTEQGHAFHGAWWVSSFGWSGYGGSHGCLNMPEDGAKQLYDFAPVGTPVVIHS